MAQVSIPDDAPPVLAASEAWHELQRLAPLDYYATLPGPEERLIERIAAAEVVLNIRASTRFTARVLTACPKLRMLSVWGTGTDHVDLVAAAERGVLVTDTPGVSAVSIAEHALALMLAVARRIPRMDASTRRGEWVRGQSIQLRGKTCGVIGLGAVGRQFARLAAAIGMRVVAWTMHPSPMEGVELMPLEELYRRSDVVSVHLRLSPETTGFLGAREFAMMKPGAILINTARGAIVDEAAMLDALRGGRLAGAGLDVFSTEPLPPGHPLLAFENVVLTPHCAGITPEALEAGLRMAVENIRAFLAGHPEHLVTTSAPNRTTSFYFPG